MQVSTVIGSLVALASLGSCQFAKVNDFKATPTNLGMWAYLPKTLKTPAPIVVAVHHCQGSAQGYSGETKYQPLAEQHGFIVIYPNSKSGGGCFDVASTASLTHNGGGDSQTIVNMVQHAVDNFGGDPDRVFTVGTSSGAMMTNVLVGAYPDVFKAGSVYSGVPDGCFFLTKTGEEWGNMVRSYYPDFNGTRPRMQIFHGTADSTLAYPNSEAVVQRFRPYREEGHPQHPQQSYTQTIYGEGTAETAQLVGYSAQGVGHSVPQHEAMDIAFFGIGA
ncbi:unnamed protein product [Parascedosporium putredinis]|uniref:Carboxylic ester hydrolase n=1 Tax=Parascedosporium putredinis TaxID=1442378 RepID=A0A9P1H0M5_9PEZI|nr:unnamed protein product [Parascedosporium putredinis]CAI7991915.1 unnamed protein product [Parascedosporium putredinis]